LFWDQRFVLSIFFAFLDQMTEFRSFVKTWRFFENVVASHAEAVRI